MAIVCGVCKRRVWFWQKKSEGIFEPFHEYYAYHKRCIDDLFEKTVDECKKEEWVAWE